MRRLIFTVIGLIAISGCTAKSTYLTRSELPVNNFFDYQVYKPNGQSARITDLPRLLEHADVILIGNWHSHTGVNHFLTDFLAQLDKHDEPIALSLGQLSRDKQVLVDAYMQNKIGEAQFIKQAKLSKNYQSNFRPLIEYAKQHEIPVIASNAPKHIVSCISLQGLNYLKKLDAKERTLVVNQIDTYNDEYKEKFMASKHHGSEIDNVNEFLAHITWDETMAESITHYLTEHPKTQIIQVAGAFHVENGLGLAFSIKQRNPELSIVQITPTTAVTYAQGTDYQLKVMPVPTRYVQQNNMLKEFEELAARNNDLLCK